jgi:hypothetical protein
VVAAVACSSLLPPASGAAIAPTGATDLHAGERGSGMPAIPVVLGRRSARAGAGIRFSDLAGFGWAKPAILHVAKTNDWMRDFAPDGDGSYRFRPGALQTRKYLARALVAAFAANAVPDPSMTFPDVDPSTAWWRSAAIAVERGWMNRAPGGLFDPDAVVTMRGVHRALVLALGLKPAAQALDRLATSDGERFDLPPSFGTTLLGMRLGLRYNAPSGSESIDVGPNDALTRAQVAFSLYRATTQPSWNVPNLLEQYGEIELPHLGPKMRQVVQWGVRYVGYPYVWGGEWGLASPVPSALGGQPRSGFDCSGLTWWLMRADDGAWNVSPPRPYAGWTLPQRTSAEMARMTNRRIPYRELKPGDIMFYDGDGDGTVDHVDTYVGHGYALDSSSTPGGVTIMWVGDGWYRDHFVHARRIIR